MKAISAGFGILVVIDVLLFLTRHDRVAGDGTLEFWIAVAITGLWGATLAVRAIVRQELDRREWEQNPHNPRNRPRRP